MIMSINDPHQKVRPDHLQQEFSDGTVNAAAGNMLADRMAVSDAFALADVFPRGLALILVVPNGHP
jgi:hypothetical protein